MVIENMFLFTFETGILVCFVIKYYFQILNHKTKVWVGKVEKLIKNYAKCLYYFVNNV